MLFSLCTGREGGGVEPGGGGGGGGGDKVTSKEAK